MNEDQLTRLRNRIKRRRERFDHSSHRFFGPNLKRFWQSLVADPFISPILNELKANRQAQWDASEFLRLCNSADGMTSPRTKQIIYDQPTDEDHIALIYNLLAKWFSESPDNLGTINHFLSGGIVNANAPYLEFRQQILGPFCDYLDDRLDDKQALSGLIVRYKHRCEWFNRQPLIEIANKAKARANDKKRAQIEDALKQDLYRYLHDQGLEFTIEPYSHDGRIDLILDQAEGMRRFLEGKVFDNIRRNAAYIVKGFGQLLHYLRQYNASDGYLLVYKTCEKQLVIDGAEQLGQIPFVRCEGKVIFVLVVDICHHDKPPSQRTQERVSLSAAELCKADPG